VGGKSVGKVDVSFVKKLGGNLKSMHKYNIKDIINNCYIFVVDKESHTPPNYPHRRVKTA
jgi:hypothetical protein